MDNRNINEGESKIQLMISKVIGISGTENASKNWSRICPKLRQKRRPIRFIIRLSGKATKTLTSKNQIFKNNKNDCYELEPFIRLLFFIKNL